MSLAFRFFIRPAGVLLDPLFLESAAEPTTTTEEGGVAGIATPNKQQAARDPLRKRKTVTIGTQQAVSREPGRLQAPRRHAIHLPTEARTTAEGDPKGRRERENQGEGPKKSRP
jgi:hypothetical protein